LGCKTVAPMHRITTISSDMHSVGKLSEQ
jgi:hypothetical protein